MKYKPTTKQGAIMKTNTQYSPAQKNIRIDDLVTFRCTAWNRTLRGYVVAFGVFGHESYHTLTVKIFGGNKTVVARSDILTVDKEAP